MKRIIAIVLSFILLAALVLPAFAEGDTEKQVAIVVPGVMETVLFFDETPDLHTRYFDAAKDYIRDVGNIKNLLFGLLKAFFLFKYDKLDEALVELNDVALGDLDMNPDGTSVRNLCPIASGAADSSLSALKKSGEWKHVDQGAMFTLTLGEQLGDENIFVFLYDWRLNPFDLAGQLDAFIDEAKEITGVDKVNIYSNSYGAQVVSTYLYSLEGCENIDRVVFNAPAWQGTSVPGLLTAQSKEDMKFNIIDGLHFVMRLMMFDYDLEPMVRLIPKRIADEVFFTLAQRTLNAHMLYMPAFWCCCTAEDYEDLKEKLLDPVRDADFIARNDEVQYGVMARIPEILDYIQAQGVTVAVTAYDGSNLFIGDRINGDYVVDIEKAAGGEVLPLGETFTDGRTGKYISPSGGLDLTNGLLPDRTWVITGQAHGQTYWDGVTNTLIPKLLLTDEIGSVFSSPEFPQFMDSRCPAMDISLLLENRVEKTLDPAEGAVKAVIRNESDANILLTGVTVSGLPYKAGPVLGTLKPGESKIITLTPTADSAEPGYGSIKVCYIDTGILPQKESRSFSFRVG